MDAQQEKWTRDTDESINPANRDSVILPKSYATVTTMDCNSIPGEEKHRVIRRRKRIDGKLTFEASCPFPLRMYRQLLEVSDLPIIFKLVLFLSVGGDSAKERERIWPWDKIVFWFI
jgi:hypothetical protein